MAANPARERTLDKLAHRVGFGEVYSLLRGDPLPPGRGIIFFIVDSHLTDEAMKRILTQFRAHPLDQVRFAPIVLVCEDGPFETMLKYIAFGFDDVITLPEKPEVLLSRLGAQLHEDIVYFETDTYLGPDRRRMELPSTPKDSRRTGNSPFTRLTLRRDPVRGVSVIRREMMGQVTRGHVDLRAELGNRMVGI